MPGSGAVSDRPDALLVTSSFLPGHGGIESYLAELCERLAPRLAVLAPAQRGGHPIPEGLPYTAVGAPRSMLWPGRKVQRDIVAEAARLGTDRIVFGTPWPLALLGPRLAAEGLRYSVIVHGAELVVPAAIPWLRHRLAVALARADLLLPVSRFTAAKVMTAIEGAGLAPPDLAVLRARIDTDRFRPDVDVSWVRDRYGLGDEPVLLCFGRLVPRKGVDRAIALVHRLAGRPRSPSLLVAGRGPEEKRLRGHAARGPGRIAFAGGVAPEEAPALYACADVFLLPVADRWFGLDFEGLGVVLCEAAACGTPCVTGRSGGTAEAVVDGTTGFVVEARDDDALRDAVTTLLDDPDKARRMGTAGRAFVEREFSGKLPDELEQWLGMGQRTSG